MFVLSVGFSSGICYDYSGGLSLLEVYNSFLMIELCQNISYILSENDYKIKE